MTSLNDDVTLRFRSARKNACEWKKKTQRERERERERERVREKERERMSE